MEVSSWKNHRTKRGIFQRATIHVFLFFGPELLIRIYEARIGLWQIILPTLILHGEDGCNIQGHPVCSEIWLPSIYRHEHKHIPEHIHKQHTGYTIKHAMTFMIKAIHPHWMIGLDLQNCNKASRSWNISWSISWNISWNIDYTLNCGLQCNHHD